MVIMVFSNSIGLFGLEAYDVKVETDLSKGIPSFSIVGLPDIAVKESKDRIRAALKNTGFEFPLCRITINLAPADIRKEGALYDLPMLISIMMASGILEGDYNDSAFIGELSLSGEVRGVNGVLPMAIKAKECGYKNFYVPAVNAQEGAVVEGINIYPVESLKSLYNHLTNRKLTEKAVPNKEYGCNTDFIPNFSDVRGQAEAKRALEIAASGGHNLLLVGSPGAGKSMLAKRVPSILPDMTFKETIETTKIYSVAGVMPEGVSLIRKRPFRAPHHTISSAGLSGGGAIPKPGEISLAHNGVLFLDELPEFSRSAMEVLRQPLEDGTVNISRVSGTLSYPCSIMLVAAMNPCPCGYFGHPTRPCTCNSKAVTKYLSKVSGPLLDRLDLHIEVPPVDFDSLSSSQTSESSEDIKKRVDKAREIQNERFKNSGINCNANITPSMLQKVCAMEDKASLLMKKSFEKMGLSARAYDRILKVARTIADLDSSEIIKSYHIAEAVQYRSMDRKYWLKEL